MSAVISNITAVKNKRYNGRSHLSEPAKHNTFVGYFLTSTQNTSIFSRNTNTCI